MFSQVLQGRLVAILSLHLFPQLLSVKVINSKVEFPCPKIVLTPLSQGKDSQDLWAKIRNTETESRNIPRDSNTSPCKELWPNQAQWLWKPKHCRHPNLAVEDTKLLHFWGAATWSVLTSSFPTWCKAPHRVVWCSPLNFLVGIAPWVLFFHYKISFLQPKFML